MSFGLGFFRHNMKEQIIVRFEQRMIKFDVKI